MGRASQRSNCGAGQSLKCALKVSTEAEVGSRLCGSKAAMTRDRVVSDLVLPLWEEVLWPFLDAWDTVRLRTASSQWNVQGRYGPYGELFFFLLKKEPMVLRELVRFGPSIPVVSMTAYSERLENGSSVSSSSSGENNVGNDTLFVIGVH